MKYLAFACMFVEIIFRLMWLDDGFVRKTFHLNFGMSILSFQSDTVSDIILSMFKFLGKIWVSTNTEFCL